MSVCIVSEVLNIWINAAIRRQYDKAYGVIQDPISRIMSLADCPES